MPELDRRALLKSLVGVGVLAAAPRVARAREATRVVMATWPHGLAAVKHAQAMMKDGASALDAVEKGINLVEDDPEVNSVGKGGLPNAEGVVQLDAAVMRGADLMVGAVAALERIKNPVSVARKV